MLYTSEFSVAKPPANVWSGGKPGVGYVKVTPYNCFLGEVDEKLNAPCAIAGVINVLQFIGGPPDATGKPSPSWVGEQVENPGTMTPEQIANELAAWNAFLGNTPVVTTISKLVEE